MFGWEVTRIKFHSLVTAKPQCCTCYSASGSASVLWKGPWTCQPALGKGNRTSVMTMAGTSVFFGSLSSDPSSSSTRIVLGSLMKCGESLTWQPSQHSLHHNSPVFLPLPHCTPQSKCGSQSRDAFLGHQSGQFSIGPNSSFVAYQAHGRLNKF